MIAFDLNCSRQHRFEGWFVSSQDYDRQRATGMVTCPICGDAQIEKALSVPNVGRKSNQQSEKSPPQQMNMVSNSPTMPAAVEEMLGKLAEVQRGLLKDSEWVGRDFADEARAIHYGEADDRLIHGETSAEEAEALAEEGVSIAPLLFPYIPDSAKN